MRILGIDFGSWSIKAVEMESRFRRFEILDVHEVKLPLQIVDPVETYREALGQLMARLPSHPEKTATSLSPAQTVLRFLQLPIRQRKKVEKTYRYELEDNIPFKWDDAIVEHHVHKTREGSLVIAGIALKRHIQSHLDWLKSVGVDPDWLTFDGMGLINLYLSSFAAKKVEKPDGPVMLLDIGHQKTVVAIFDEDRLQYYRTLTWGGSAITQSIALHMTIALEQAEQYKINELKLDADIQTASDQEKELLAAAVQGLGPLLTDLNQNLVAFRNLYKKPVSSVLLSGGTSRLWGLPAFLEAKLNTPVNLFNPLQEYKIKQGARDEEAQRFGESLGRALVFNRKSTLLFNFRQQELGKGTSLNEVSTILQNPGIRQLLKFACVLAGVLFVHVFVSSYLAKNEARTAVEELRKELTRTFPAVPAKQRTSLTNSPKELRKFINQKNTELDRRLKILSKTRTPMLTMLSAVSSAFPPTVKVDVNTLQLDDRSFNMEGVIYSGDLNQVTEALKKITFLSQIQLTQEGQRFTYRGEVVGR